MAELDRDREPLDVAGCRVRWLILESTIGLAGSNSAKLYSITEQTVIKNCLDSCGTLDEAMKITKEGEQADKDVAAMMQKRFPDGIKTVIGVRTGPPANHARI